LAEGSHAWLFHVDYDPDSTGVFLGAETRYFRKYDALDLPTFAGTMYVRFSKSLAISGA
jgi:hypothetical protein